MDMIRRCMSVGQRGTKSLERGRRLVLLPQTAILQDYFHRLNLRTYLPVLCWAHCVESLKITLGVELWQTV